MWRKHLTSILLVFLSWNLATVYGVCEDSIALPFQDDSSLILDSETEASLGTQVAEDLHEEQNQGFDTEQTQVKAAESTAEFYASSEAPSLDESGVGDQRSDHQDSTLPGLEESTSLEEPGSSQRDATEQIAAELSSDEWIDEPFTDDSDLPPIDEQKPSSSIGPLNILEPVPENPQNTDDGDGLSQSGKGPSFDLSSLFERDRLSGSLKLILTMSILSLAPAILLMTTSFIRITIVLSMLRHAFGGQQIPPNQVTTSLAIFLTGLIMWPVWTSVYNDAIVPYTSSDANMNWQEAWDTGVQPVRRFMSRQIDEAGNGEDVFLFLRHLPDTTHEPENYDEVPLQALLPAFVLSELKTAFLLGFQILLPFLIIDLVVATVTTSMGMIMLPPTVMALPLKLLLFVLVDGWRLIVDMLLQSFAPFS